MENDFYYFIFTVSGVIFMVAFVLYSIMESVFSFFTIKGILTISFLMFILLCNIFYKESEPLLTTPETQPIPSIILQSQIPQANYTPEFCNNFISPQYLFSLKNSNCINF